MPSTAFAERILRFVQTRGYEPQKLEQLARAMGIGEDEHGDFHAACRALMKSGRVVLGSQNALMLPPPSGKVVGIFRANPRGFGFIIPDTPNSHGDLYVPAGRSGGAVTGDTVRATIKKRGKRQGKMLYEGKVVEIVKRGQSHFVGELHRQFSRWFVVPDGNAFHTPIVVADAGAKKGRPGDQVVVEITQYPDEGVEARGVIVKVLGRRGEPGVDTLSVIEQHGLPGEFGNAVLKEARKVVASYDATSEADHREDLRKLTIITIDPPDAKDFDDAVSITTNADGTTELGVHIADVSRFVREGGALDREARERSTSVYLSDRVIPMLPEVLSNGLCSLQERQPRLTKSVFITYDRRGKVKKARVVNAIIQSAKRLTYAQATKILDGKRGRVGAKIVALLREMERLAKAIRRRRLREGMLVLDLPEIDLVYDDDGAVIDVEPAETSFSHTIIEMFMVEANEAIARLLVDRNVPALRRVHGEPEITGDGNLQRFLTALGYDLPKKIDRHALQALLKRAEGKKEAFAVNLAVLRSMQQAEYSPARIGHYALASENYCHFTSPIRRYPDLTIHRLLDAYISGVFDRPRGVKQVPSVEELTALGNHCSANDRRAEAAARELRLVLLLRLLEKHVGEVFGGIVTGVANVGVFVQLDRFLVDGLLRFTDLADDWWEIDSSRGAVVGERSGCQIKVGDRMKVIVSSIQIPTRQLNLAPATPLKTARTGRRKTATRSSQTKTRGRPRAHPSGRPVRKRSGGKSRGRTLRKR